MCVCVCVCVCVPNGSNGLSVPPPTHTAGNFNGCKDVHCIANLIKVWFRDLPPQCQVLHGKERAGLGL